MLDLATGTCSVGGFDVCGYAFPCDTIFSGTGERAILAEKIFPNGDRGDEAGTAGRRTTEEMANCEFVKSRNDRKDLGIEDLRDHLARFPAGTTAHDARALLAEVTWDGLRPTSTVEALREFVDELPTIEWAKVARVWLKEAERRASERNWADGPRSNAKSGRLAPRNRLEPMGQRGNQTRGILFRHSGNPLFGDVNAQREATAPRAPQATGRMSRFTLPLLVLLFAVWICSTVDHTGIVGDTFYFGFIPLVLTIAASLGAIVAGVAKLMRRILGSLDSRS